MDWIKTSTTYYLAPALMRAGEAAEVLWMRASAYCGDQENDGLVEEVAVPRLCPTGWEDRAAALVREGLWEVVDGVGWRFVEWKQVSAERLEREREASRIRQQEWRDRQKEKAAKASRHSVRNGVTNDVGSGEVTEQRRGEQRALRALPAAGGAPTRARCDIHTHITLRSDGVCTSCAGDQKAKAR